MLYERMRDGDTKPTEDDIITYVGKKSPFWLELRDYLNKHYDVTPELVFYGKKYGWTIRYRKSRKTLCSLFPEKGAFTVLIVLGGKEVDKTLSMIDDLSPDVRTLFENTEQLRDGRWLWIQVMKKEDMESVKLLLSVKRKPKRVE
ncbi:MAG: DUF3788 domain-containing protein [Gemmatimonadota bacterium]|nr:MAG: DUF3788 domain-containing protein [Gemmatimonadota bacterium]